MRWNDVLSDPTLKALPYKIELSRAGKIEMTPASNRRGNLQSRVGTALSTQLPEGEIITECAIETADGVRVPDVAWASAAFISRHGFATPLPAAPEICVEILPPGNTEQEIQGKMRHYFDLGAREVWLVSENGDIRYFDVGSQRADSAFGVTLSLPRYPRQ